MFADCPPLSIRHGFKEWGWFSVIETRLDFHILSFLLPSHLLFFFGCLTQCFLPLGIASSYMMSVSFLPVRKNPVSESVATQPISLEHNLVIYAIDHFAQLTVLHDLIVTSTVLKSGNTPVKFYINCSPTKSSLNYSLIGRLWWKLVGFAANIHPTSRNQNSTLWGIIICLPLWRMMSAQGTDVFPPFLLIVSKGKVKGTWSELSQWDHLLEFCTWASNATTEEGVGGLFITRV